MTANGKQGKLTWGELWEVRNSQEDLKIREKWDRALGFVLLPGRNPNIVITPEFHNILENCSITHLIEILSGAPIELVGLYLHHIPRKDAEKLIRNFFRPKDIGYLKELYWNPPQLNGAPVIENGPGSAR